MDSLKKSFLIIALIIGIVAMTVAFSTLSTNLNISGATAISETTWNIHFQNWALDTVGTVTEGGITHQNTAVYPSISTLSNSMSLKPNVTKVENLNITLKQPGDYVKYTFEIINEGSIDASLNNFTHAMTCESGKTCNHLTYTVECKDSQENNVLTQYSTLYKNGGLAYCTLQVKYNEQTNTGNTVYTQEAVSATLSANWQYIQKVDNNSGSGNSGSGGNEPVVENVVYKSHSNPYGTTTFDNEWEIYIKNVGLTTPEVCGVFSNGTVCLTSSYYNSDYSNVGNYKSDFEEAISGTYDLTNIATSGLKGYALAKAEEMLSKGASSCGVYYQYVRCYRTVGGSCSVYDGSVNCYDSALNNCGIPGSGGPNCT